MDRQHTHVMVVVVQITVQAISTISRQLALQLHTAQRRR